MRRKKRPIYSTTYRTRRWVFIGLALLVLVGGGLGSWWVLSHRNPRPSATQYPVLGVQLDQTDGDPDFPGLHKAGVSFAYLKATEGASYFDDNFTSNYQHATAAGLAVGVVHVLSFDSTPAKQVNQFVTCVGQHLGSLPIGIAVSYYGNYATNPPRPAVVRQQLSALIAALTAKVHRAVVIMATPAILTTVKTVSPNSARWAITAKKPQAAYWQYATAKVPNGPDTDYRMAVFTGSRSAFASQSNKTVR